MIGHYGNVSSPAYQRAGTRPISVSSAVRGGAGPEDGGRKMNWGEELAFAGGSSAAIMRGRWLCPLCNKPFTSQHAVYGHMRVHNSLSKLDKELVSILQELGKPFPSQHAGYEHVPIHNSPSNQEKEVASILLELGQLKSHRTEGSGTGQQQHRG